MAKLIHVAQMQRRAVGTVTLYLREVTPHHFVWYEETDKDKETETAISASNVQEAMRLAQREWHSQGFRTIICGFRYTLPERDEHGMNALFHQMAASYSTPNGVYFDEDLGHNCTVQNASQEALCFWENLKNEGRL